MLGISKCLNLNFVQDINVVGKKMTKDSHKIVPRPICDIHFGGIFSVDNIFAKLVKMFSTYNH